MRSQPGQAKTPAVAAVVRLDQFQVRSEPDPARLLAVETVGLSGHSRVRPASGLAGPAVVGAGRLDPLEVSSEPGSAKAPAIEAVA